MRSKAIEIVARAGGDNLDFVVGLQGDDFVLRKGDKDLDGIRCRINSEQPHFTLTHK